MSRLKTRVSGSWVTTDASGAVWPGGVKTTFGPPAGAAYEALAWPNPVPNLLDADDSLTRYSLGVRFKLLNAKNCVGVQWRVPTNAPSPTNSSFAVGHSVSLWNGDTTVRMATKDFTPVPGGYQDILFDIPQALNTVSEYVVSVYTFHYVHRAATWNVTSPSGNIVADAGRFVADQGPAVFPAGNSNAWYYVSPLVTL
jgi:hypothetical protein